MTKQVPKYDDEFRASALVMLEAAGYPDTLGAMERVAAHLNVPGRTLRRWYTGQSNPPPDRIVARKKIDLAQAVRDELSAIFADMESKREEASYRDLTIAAGVLIDKQQLLEGKPTAINEDRVSDSRSKLADLIAKQSPLRDADGDTQFVQ